MLTMKYLTLFTITAFLLFNNSLKAEESYKSYTECKKSVLKGVSKFNDSKGLVDQCRKKFPVHKSLLKCKKSVIAASKNQKESSKETCRNLRKISKIEDSDVFPIIYYRGDLYVNQVEMSDMLGFDWVSNNGMDCSNLKEAIEDSSKANYIFYGVDIRRLKLNKGLIKNSGKELASGDIKISDYLVVSKDKGKRLGFFPSGRCDYKTPENKFINAISHFYLIDYEGKKLFPYAAVFFYNNKRMPNINKIKNKSLEKSLGYLNVETRSDSKIFVSNSKIVDFDSEKDPKNICALNSDLMSAIIGSIEKENRVESVVITNSKSYCRYVNRVSKRLKSL